MRLSLLTKKHRPLPFLLFSCHSAANGVPGQLAGWGWERRNLLFSAVAALYLLGSHNASAQTATNTPSYRITGVVLNSVTGNPVPYCHLDASLSNYSRPGGGLPAFTSGAGGFVGRGFNPRRQNISSGYDADAHGHFSIPVDGPGGWHLTASAPGYVTQAFDEHTPYSSAIVLTPQSPTYDLQFRLPPQGRITGAVLDEAGEPVRNAQVQLMSQPLTAPGSSTSAGPGQFSTRQSVQTDDRGEYEFAGIAPGSYRVMVQARPWYTNYVRRGGVNMYAGGGIGAGFSSGPLSSAASPPIDPALDVTYQNTWYPGTPDAAQAGTITIKPGDERRADFNLIPIPALHLEVLLPPASTQPDPNGRFARQPFPIVERIDGNNGFGGGGGMQTVSNNNGRAEISGLTPGTYRVRIQTPTQGQGPPQDQRSTIIQITEGSSRVLDLSGGESSSLATVTVHFANDSDANSDARPGGIVELTDTATGHRFQLNNNRPMPIRNNNARNGQPGAPNTQAFQAQRPAQRDSSIELPPGQYEVGFSGRGGDTYLTGLSAQGAELSGHTLTLHENAAATLTLRTASGHATVTGIATINGKPAIGVAILLVPAGLDDPGSFTRLARDQSNTDGSFDLQNVIPGQYILIAVEHGWQVNYADPSTLGRYLTQGTPLDLRSGSEVQQKIEAQAP